VVQACPCALGACGVAGGGTLGALLVLTNGSPATAARPIGRGGFYEESGFEGAAFPRN